MRLVIPRLTSNRRFTLCFLVSFSYLFCSIPLLLAQRFTPTFEWSEDCPFGRIWLNGRKVKCGYLTVLEDREKPNGMQLKLAVVLIKSQGQSVNPDPVVYLSGGPGSGAITSIRAWLDHPLLAHRDIILYDQRGTGFSEPTACESLKDENLKIAFGNYQLDEEVEARYQAAMRCKDELTNLGIDRSKYNSIESAKDLEDLRLAMRYDQWNLYGISYGTRLALHTMRLFPEGIRSVVIDGVIPPNVSNYQDINTNFVRSLHLVFEQCAGDPNCKKRFPHLERDFYQFIDTLAQQPIFTTIPDSVYMNPQDFELLMHQCLYSHQFLPYIPLIIEQLKQKNESALQAILGSIRGRSNAINYWMMHSVNNFDVGAFTSTALFEKDAVKFPQLKGGLSLFKADTKIFENWHPNQADSTLFRAVASTIPTLVISGEFDPITPPMYADLAHQSLAQSYHYVYPGLGHGASLSGACPKEMVANFLNHPTNAPDSTCMKRMPTIAFVTNLWLNEGVYKFATEVLRSPKFSNLLLPVLALVALFTAFAFYPLYAMIQRIRKAKLNSSTYARLYKWFGWGIATLGLVYVGFLVIGIGLVASQNPIVLAFGLPSWAVYFRFLPWIIGFGGLFILLFSTWLWKVKRWNRPMRIHFIILGIAASYLGSLAIYYGLF
ncbi:MAG: alpha/beta hydrolase [Flammeovirgaceae bacterium]